MELTPKFLFFSEYGETLDLAIHLHEIEQVPVRMYIDSKKYKRIGDGIVPKSYHWYRHLGEGYTWVFDSCSFGDMQDWLREKGEAVFGGSAAGDEMENVRQKNQEWFREAGFHQPESHNFTQIDEAISFVGEHKEKRWILKQNGDAPKRLSHKGEFDDNADMLFHLHELKKKWNVSDYGPLDFDLMEVVEGVEIAASAFFNGEDFLRNPEGKVVGYLNFEEKKEGDGGTGEMTGEMGTTFFGVTEDNETFKQLLLRPKIIEKLRELKFRGVFDLNTIHSRNGFIALEPTLRFGLPATSYELIEGLACRSSDLLATCARGSTEPIAIKDNVGMVICIVAKPFPIESEQIDTVFTSAGEKLWILKDGNPVKTLRKEQLRHVHLYNFERATDDTIGALSYKVATPEGYMLTVTGSGDSIPEVRDGILRYIKDNIFLSGMKYRTDIGKRVEHHAAQYR